MRPGTVRVWLWDVILSVFLYHESVSFLAIAGVILVFAGVIICNLSDDESQVTSDK